MEDWVSDAEASARDFLHCDELPGFQAAIGLDGGLEQGPFLLSRRGLKCRRRGPRGYNTCSVASQEARMARASGGLRLRTWGTLLIETWA